MKPRHAAALALVGEYVMQPPTHRVNSQTIFEDSAPLTSWRQMYSYDVAKQCQDEIGHLQTFPPVAAVHGDHARCVASDDPRLKGN